MILAIMTNTQDRKPGLEFVDILVGPTEEAFHIHRELICHHSPYFKTVIDNAKSVGGKDKEIKEPAIDEDVFGLFNHWIYFQQIETAPASLTIMLLTRLWTSAGAWKIPALQDQVIRILSKMMKNLQEPPTLLKNSVLRCYLEHAYSTQKWTPLKKVGVWKMMLCLPAIGSVKETIREFPEGMVGDFVEALVKYSAKAPEPAKLLACEVYVQGRQEYQ